MEITIKDQVNVDTIKNHKVGKGMLAYNPKEETFHEVSFLGRIVKWLKGNILRDPNAYADCKSDYVAANIQKFINEKGGDLQLTEADKSLLNGKIIAIKMHMDPDIAIKASFQRSNPIELQFVSGNIADKKHLSSVDVVVNAANAEMAYGLGGTNEALSKIYTKESWEGEVNKYFKANNKKQLDVSEVASFKLNAKDNKWTDPPLLFQALGPNLRSSKEDLDENALHVYQTYKNIFSKCNEQGKTSVLVPMLSTGAFAGKYLDDPAWKSSVQKALFKAIEEELENPDSTLKTIKIINFPPENIKERVKAAGGTLQLEQDKQDRLWRQDGQD